MNEQVIFLKERMTFLIDHIELFLEDYNRLTLTYPNIPTEISHFDFYYISNANRYIWEYFHIDANDFRVASNDSSLLTGLVLGKTYLVPPMFSKEKIERFLTKLERYRYLVGLDVSCNYSEKMEQIYGELNDNRIHLQIMIDGKIELFSLEQVCQMLIRYRNFKKLARKMQEQQFASKLKMELGYLEQIIVEQMKITV